MKFEPINTDNNESKDYNNFALTQKISTGNNNHNFKDRFYLRKNSLAKTPNSNTNNNTNNSNKNSYGFDKDSKIYLSKEDIKLRSTTSKNNIKNYKVDFSYIYNKNKKNESYINFNNDVSNANGQGVAKRINESIKSKRNFKANKDSLI